MVGALIDGFSMVFLDVDCCSMVFIFSIVFLTNSMGSIDVNWFMISYAIYFMFMVFAAKRLYSCVGREF